MELRQNYNKIDQAAFPLCKTDCAQVTSQSRGVYLKRVLGLMFSSLRRVLFIMILSRSRSLAAMHSLPFPFLPHSFLGRVRDRERPGPAENQASVYIRQSISDNLSKSSSSVLTDPKI